jgi:hypothetical protein
LDHDYRIDIKKKVQLLKVLLRRIISISDRFLTMLNPLDP